MSDPEVMALREDHKGPSETAVDGIHAHDGSSVASIRLVGFDRPFLSAVALVLAILACVIGYLDFHERTANEYWQQRIETFIEQMASEGYHVPPDILRHIEKEH